MGFGNYPGTGGELEVGSGRREEAEKRLCVGGVVGEHGGVSWVWHDVADAMPLALHGRLAAG
jgi:hypothetical protein